MTDRNTKFLNKLSAKEHDKVMAAIALIMSNELRGLDIKPLTGHKNMFRARVGRTRIIFTRDSDNYELVAILNRDDKTYKNL